MLGPVKAIDAPDIDNTGCRSLSIVKVRQQTPFSEPAQAAFLRCTFLNQNTIFRQEKTIRPQSPFYGTQDTMYQDRYPAHEAIQPFRRLLWPV
jgi:hypothetical protein